MPSIVRAGRHVFSPKCKALTTRAHLVLARLRGCVHDHFGKVPVDTRA